MTVESPPREPKGAPLSGLRSRFRAMREDRGFRRPAASGGIAVLLSFAVVAIVVAWSVVPSLFTSYSAVLANPAAKFEAPSAPHWLGTDNLGRDEFARIVHGAGSSVGTALVAVGIGLFAGGLIGLAGGFIGGWVDAVLGRLVDTLLAIPGFLLAVVVVTGLGFDTLNAAIATGVSSVAIFARLMRAEVLKVRHAVFVESSYLQGGSRRYVLLRHVLPNAYRSVLALAVLQLGTAIIVIAALAFLGYGSPPPASDWGQLVADGQSYATAPWLVYGPAIVIVITVLSINRISRWLRNTN
jgi:peptide/nickel transport system permease protein